MKQNVFFIIIHKTIHAQSQWPSSRPLKYYNYTMIEMWIFID